MTQRPTIVLQETFQDHQIEVGIEIESHRCLEFEDKAEVKGVGVFGITLKFQFKATAMLCITNMMRVRLLWHV